MREIERGMNAQKMGLGARIETQNSCEGPEQLEDEPIGFFLCPNIDFDGKILCKLYVLQSFDATSDRELAGGDDKDIESGSPITVTIEKLCFLGGGTGKMASCRLTELPEFPSLLPHNKYPCQYRVFAFESCIYLLGGKETSRPDLGNFDVTSLRDVYYFDRRLPKEGWIKNHDMLSTRIDPCAVAFSEKIYVIGDKAGRGGPFGEVLDTGSHHWSELARLPSSLENAYSAEVVAVLEFGRKILLYSSQSQQLFYYDIKLNEWFVVANDFGFWMGRLTVALDCVFCFGNLNDYGDDFSLSAFDLVTGSWLPVEGLKWDGDMMPRSAPISADLFNVNHNKLAFVWTEFVEFPYKNFKWHTPLHYSKFLIHKTSTCIRVEPYFWLSAVITTSGMPVCVPLLLNGGCFGLRDLDYYEEEKGARELMLKSREEVVKGRGNTVMGDNVEVKEKETVMGDSVEVKEKESWKTVLMREPISRQHMFSGKGKASAPYNPESNKPPTISTKNSTGKGKGNCTLQPRKQTNPNNLNRKFIRRGEGNRTLCPGRKQTLMT